LDALVYLHNQQPPVVHRDIKPANIRITPDGRAMLVDFGLVKMNDSGTNTTMGARAITPGYAPPEQYGRDSADPRTDVYALGATIYHILTGRDPIESVQRMAGEQLPSVQAVNPKVTAPVSQAIERAMALEPGQRFQTAEPWLHKLKRRPMLISAQLILPWRIPQLQLRRKLPSM
jgi:serine/threonine protein kinase